VGPAYVRGGSGGRTPRYSAVCPRERLSVERR